MASAMSMHFWKLMRHHVLLFRLVLSYNGKV